MHTKKVNVESRNQPIINAIPSIENIFRNIPSNVPPTLDKIYLNITIKTVDIKPNIIEYDRHFCISFIPTPTIRIIYFVLTFLEETTSMQ